MSTGTVPSTSAAADAAAASDASAGASGVSASSASSDGSVASAHAGANQDSGSLTGSRAAGRRAAGSFRGTGNGNGGAQVTGSADRVPLSQRRLVPARHVGRKIFTALVVLLVVPFLVMVLSNPRWEWGVVAQWFTAQSIIRGLVATLLLTAIAAVGGFVIGFFLALMRLSSSPILRLISWSYIWLFRSVPLLVQLLLWYNLGYLYDKLRFGIPFGGPTFFEVQTTTLISQFAAAVLGLTLHQAAYCAEIIRGGILSVDQTQLEAAAAQIQEASGKRVHALPGDLGDPQEISRVMQEAIERMGGLDILVNSVPAPVFGAFMDHSEQAWESALQLKLLSYVRLIRAAAPALSEGADAVVVNIIGIGGKTYIPNHIAGGASNAALMLITSGLAREFGAEGIRVVGINPGSTQTERFESLLHSLAASEGISAEEVRARMERAVPSGKVLSVEQIADLATFLASPRSSALNGVVVQADGGMLSAI